jgi:hypothetical protein
MLPDPFQQLPQILKHASSSSERAPSATKSFWYRSNACPFTAAVPSLSFRSQELFSVHRAFSRVPCVINRSESELIERYFRLPIELRDRVRNQPVRLEQLEILYVNHV